MANLATTATESLQCIACAIRQDKHRMIEVDDITEYLTNVKERRDTENSTIDMMVEIPNNAVQFLMRWYESGTEMSEMLESELYVNHMNRNRRCWCTHECSVGLSIPYHPHLVEDLLYGAGGGREVAEPSEIV